MRRRGLGAVMSILTAAAAVILPGRASAQEPGLLFPVAFTVEHSVVQTDADGSVFAADPVVDTYAGSWIVSERADGSRLVIDFARREITEIRPADGRYTVITFDRMAELLRELDALEGAPRTADKSIATANAEPDLRVEEIGASEFVATKSLQIDAPLFARNGVRHLRVSVAGLEKRGGDVVLDAWFDPDIRFTSRALGALEDFERDVLGAVAGPQTSPGLRSTALARREADGALPIRTVRPLVPGIGSAASVEDRALRVEVLETVRSDLVVVPEGLRRSPHPLEVMVAHARREAELRSLMGGGAR